MKAIRLIMFSLAVLLTGLLLALSTTPFFTRSATLDYLSGYRFLYVLLSLPVVLFFTVLCFRRRSRAIIALLLCATISLIVNWLEIRAFFYRVDQPLREKGHTTSWRLISLNLKGSQASPREVMSFLAREAPDLIVLLDMNPMARASFDELRETFAHHLSYPELEMEIFSRLPLEAQSVRRVGNTRGDVVLKVDRKLHVVACHTYPWKAHGAQGYEWRNQHLQELGPFLRDCPSPVAALGSFHASPWSLPFKELLEHSRLRDARTGFGPVRTHSKVGLFFLLGTPIDHCLVSENLQVRRLRSGPALGSDHLPLIVDIAF